jgi:hypothetical protein
MRFYLKLGLIVATFAGIQRGINAYEQPIRELSFAIHCLVARQSSNEQLMEYLIQEGWRIVERDREQILARMRDERALRAPAASATGESRGSPAGKRPA